MPGRKTRTSKPHSSTSVDKSITASSASSAASASFISKTRKSPSKIAPPPPPKRIKTVKEIESDEESKVNSECDDSIKDPHYREESGDDSSESEVNSLHEFQKDEPEKSPIKPVSSCGKAQSRSTPRIPVLAASPPTAYSHYLIEGTLCGCIHEFKHMFKCFQTWLTICYVSR